MASAESSHKTGHFSCMSSLHRQCLHFAEGKTEAHRGHLVWFGPFGEHTVNASWIAVQELEKLGLGDSVDLHVYEIPVEYQTVQRLIPALWEKHSPQLVVHVGVSGMATAVTLEKCGHNKGYKGLDNCRFCPGSQCCVEDGPESIDSIIDMDAVCKRVTTLGLDVSVTISQDAGRYLCDFTYYTSLYQSHGRSAFVHVPPLGKPYNADQLGRALRAIIEEMLDVLEQSEGKINCCQNTECHSGLPRPHPARDSERDVHPPGPDQEGQVHQLRI
uniref:Pyroglutamyl-peptidase I n=1 Tax=Sus scrofa TaxID=9823 RepID=A0A8D0XGA1_PIG